jgi:prepilin-type processing-associated H-X9-DG protein
MSTLRNAADSKTPNKNPNGIRAALVPQRMKCHATSNQETGFTFIEVLVIVVLVGILLLLILPARHSERVTRVRCSVTLKQVAMGFALWANENHQRLPMELPVSASGTREHALAGNLLSNYLVVANQIGDPGSLLCPSDKRRKPATNFTNLTTVNISYFLNADAAYTNQSHILAGDRDITTTGSPAAPGLLPIPDPSVIGWGRIHNGQGTIALADGSVHQTTANQFRTQLTTGITNRLIIP